VGRLDLEPLADENLEALRRAPQRVSFGHARQRSGARLAFPA
jgi:hypothetical protein